MSGREVCSGVHWAEAGSPFPTLGWMGHPWVSTRLHTDRAAEQAAGMVGICVLNSGGEHCATTPAQQLQQVAMAGVQAKRSM